MRWSFDGPDKPLLTKREVYEYLKIGSRALDKLIMSGHFPRGINPGRAKGKGRLRWYAQDVVCYLFYCDRLREGPLEKEEEGDDDGDEG